MRAGMAAIAFALLIPAWATAQVSENVVLFANENPKGSGYNDCWGFVSGADEYAVIGYGTGTLFYRVTDPGTPVLVGDIPGVSSIWRDMKVNGNYCYIVTEGTGGGLQIVDISDPDNPVLATTYTGFSTAHNIFIDNIAERAYVIGSDLGSGGMRILDIGTNPTSPTEVGSWETEYIHDLYVENDTAYVGCIYAGQFRILDASNPASVTNAATLSYGHSSHATWLLDSTPGYLLTADEESGGIIRCWDISNLGSISQVSSYGTGVGSSVHNIFSKNDTVYTSYYTEGLRVIDYTDPMSPVEIGYYDTYQGGGGPYEGMWGAYPYLPSGTIIGSDISTGLWLFRYIPDAGTVAGTVTDTSGTFAVPGLVSLPNEGLSDATDVNGDYSIAAPGGNRLIVTTAFGFYPDSTNVPIVAATTVTHDVSLVPAAGSSIGGTVTATGKAGLADAQVVIVGVPRSDQTGVGGSYDLPYVPPGSYQVIASKTGYDPDTAAVNVVDGVPSVVDFVLNPWFLSLDMESDPVWTAGAGGDNATTGIWERVDPNGTSDGAVQPEDDHTPVPGVLCWITGQSSPGAGIGDNDVDGGRTTLLTGIFDLSSLLDPEVNFHRWFTNDAGSAPGTDPWVVSISNNGGGSWATVESTLVSAASWTEVNFLVSDYVTPTSTVQLRFIARDDGSGSVVEAGIDDFGIHGAPTATVGIDDRAPGSAPGMIRLGQNRPNPFNPTTRIEFALPSTMNVDLAVYDPAGRLVNTLVRAPMKAGTHAAVWNGTDRNGNEVASGIYLYRLKAGGNVETRKLLLIR